MPYPEGLKQLRTALSWIELDVSRQQAAKAAVEKNLAVAEAKRDELRASIALLEAAESCTTRR